MSEHPQSKSQGTSLFIIALIVCGAIWYLNQSPAPPKPTDNPPPLPPPMGPSLAGRWVSTNAAEEVLDLSPSGEVTISDRQSSLPFTGRYRQSGNQLIFDLNHNGTTRAVSNDLVDLGQNQLTLHLPALTGIREARTVVYWRIDRLDQSKLRRQLIGRWQDAGQNGLTLQFNDDDTIQVTEQGQPLYGIFRVVGLNLEYGVYGPTGLEVNSAMIQSLTELSLTLLTADNQTLQWTRLP